MNPAVSSHTIQPAWRIHLFGVLRVASIERDAVSISRFRTRTTGSLLAYLAFHIGAAKPREVAIDAIWPDVKFSSARTRFSLALSALRKQLATATVTPHDIFVSDAHNIALNPSLFVTDVDEFEAALRRARRQTDPAVRLTRLDAALALYRDDLLVGQYENWIDAERSRLRSLYDQGSLERSQIEAGCLVPSRRGPLPESTPLTTPSTVPPFSTRFFGRSGEVSYICEQLTANDGPRPLITLTGIGGIGKSRLAAECARRVAAEFAGRVWFVELADKTEPPQVWTALRDTLGLEKRNSGDTLQQIGVFLGDAPAVLILDNLEQFVGTGAATRFVNELRYSLPNVCLLVTSRHVLGAYGEQILPIRSLLSVADWAQTPGTPGDAAACVDLFSDRARIANPAFAASSSVLGDLLAISAKLEGIPLALELAAARCNLLTPSQLLRQLSNRFTLLQSTRRDVPARHSSLYAAVDTSYNLLSEPLKKILRTMSVFRGGWTIDALQSICQIDDMAAWDATSELSDRSLVQPVTPAAFQSELVARFRLLETIRDFASAALHKETVEADTAKQRHHSFYLDLAMRFELELATGGEAVRLALDVLEAEHDNIRTALDGTQNGASSAAARPEQMLHAAFSLHGFCLRRGYAEEGKLRLMRCLDAAPTAPVALRAKAHTAVGTLSWSTGALAEALCHFNQALPYFEEEGDLRRLAAVLNNIGVVSEQNGSNSAARLSYTRSLWLFRSLGDVSASRVMTNLAAVLIKQNDFEAATTVLTDGLALQRASGDQLTALQTLQSLGEIALLQGDLDAASGSLRESWAIRQAFGEQITLWEPLLTTARLLLERGDAQNARNGCVLFGAARAALGNVDAGTTLVSTVAEAQAVEKAVRLQTRHVPDYETLWRLGSEMAIDAVMAFALGALDEETAKQN